MAEWTSERPFPRGLLVTGAAVMVFGIGAAAFASFTGVGKSNTVVPVAVEQRDLLFADRADGAVVVTDANAPGTLVRVVPAGTDGFIRVAVRGLAHDRQRKSIGSASESAFRLVRSADNRIWLIDLATDSKVEVSAFGPQNRDVFAQLLPSGRQFVAGKAAP